MVRKRAIGVNEAVAGLALSRALPLPPPALAEYPRNATGLMGTPPSLRRLATRRDMTRHHHAPLHPAHRVNGLGPVIPHRAHRALGHPARQPEPALAQRFPFTKTAARNTEGPGRMVFGSGPAAFLCRLRRVGGDRDYW